MHGSGIEPRPQQQLHRLVIHAPHAQVRVACVGLVQNVAQGVFLGHLEKENEYTHWCMGMDTGICICGESALLC